MTKTYGLMQDAAGQTGPLPASLWNCLHEFTVMKLSCLLEVKMNKSLILMWALGDGGQAFRIKESKTVNRVVK